MTSLLPCNEQEPPPAAPLAQAAPQNTPPPHQMTLLAGDCAPLGRYAGPALKPARRQPGSARSGRCCCSRKRHRIPLLLLLCPEGASSQVCRPARCTYVLVHRTRTAHTRQIPGVLHRQGDGCDDDMQKGGQRTGQHWDFQDYARRRASKRTAARKTLLLEVPQPRLLRLSVLHAAADATWYRDEQRPSLSSSVRPSRMKCSMHWHWI